MEGGGKFAFLLIMLGLCVYKIKSKAKGGFASIIEIH
jgi:hypothetical protein